MSGNSWISHHRLWLLLAAAATATLAGFASGATAANAPTFSVTVAPHTLSSGALAVAGASFTNNGPAVDHVALTLTFPLPVHVRSGRCVSLPILPRTVVCLLGRIEQGQTRSAAVGFNVPAGITSLTVNGSAGFLSTGRGRPSSGLLTASDTAGVFASGDPAHKGSCATAPSGATSATADDQQVSLVTLPGPADPSLQQLGCTPVGVAVDPPTGGFTTDLFSVDLPALDQPAQVELTFPDEHLPLAPVGAAVVGGPQTDEGAPAALHELSKSNVDLGPVPACVSGQIPSGFDSCVDHVVVNDSDGDGDAGTFVLLVQGSGLGDPRYAG